MNYKEKYFKYKTKYLELKRQFGGELNFFNKEGANNIEKFYTDNLTTFLNLLQKNTNDNLTMIIGYSVTDPSDVARDLELDIGMSLYRGAELEALHNSLLETDESKIKNYIFNQDFNLSIILGALIDLKSEKIQNIIFDSSTFKFINDIKLLAILYYLTLKVGGSIYIEFNSFEYNCSVLERSRENKDMLKRIVEGFKIGANDCFFIQSCNKISSALYSSLTSEEKIEVDNVIFNKETLYEKNRIYLGSLLLNSEILLINNSDINYPINNLKYPIVKYYKITKLASVEIPEIKKMSRTVYFSRVCSPLFKF